MTGGLRPKLLALLGGVAVCVGIELAARVALGDGDGVVPLHGPALPDPEAVAGATVLAPTVSGTDPFVPAAAASPGSPASPGPSASPACFRTTPALTQGPTPVLHRVEVCLPKPAGAVRVAVVGGSETFGLPFADEATRTYPGVLQALIERAFPGRAVEVLNLGLVGQESPAMVAMGARALALDLDALVYTGGGNDFRWYYERAGESNPDLWAIRTQASGLATFRLVERGLGRAPAVRYDAQPEDLVRRAKEAQRRFATRRWEAAGRALVRWDGDVPTRDDPDHDALVAAYGAGVATLARRATAAGVPLVVAPPPVNVHVPPEVAPHDPSVPAADVARYDAVVADRNATGDALAAVIPLDRACASGWWALGLARKREGRVDDAWAALTVASRLDQATLRFPPAYVDVARAACAAPGGAAGPPEEQGGACVFVDPGPPARAATAHYGLDLFTSPTHFSYRGAAVVAESVAGALIPVLERRLGVPAAAGWALLLPPPTLLPG